MARNEVSFKTKQYWTEIGSAVGNAPNKFWHCVAADASKDGERIQGLGFGGAYVDEATRVPDEYLSMVISRCLEVPGSKIVYTMNPGHPASKFKTGRWNRVEKGEQKGSCWEFGFADNPILSPDDVEELCKSFAKGSAFYRRMVLGQWATSEGAVHPHVTYEPQKGPVARYEVALDYASSSVTHAVSYTHLTLPTTPYV